MNFKMIILNEINKKYKIIDIIHEEVTEEGFLRHEEELRNLGKKLKAAIKQDQD